MEKKTVQDYIDIINQKNAKELMTEVEPKVNNLTACCKAMIEIMLEGDRFMELPKVKTKIGGALTVRYYCDNLSPERRKYSEVNQ